MSSNKKNLLKTILANHAACGCGRSKPSHVHQPSQGLTKANKFISTVSRKASNPSPSSSTSSSSSSNNKEDSISASTVLSVNTSSLVSESCTENGEGHDRLKATSKIVDSIAVVKDSSDPYQDFKALMLQMIMEKEMFTEDDLQELLNCFLELNSPYHHGVIIEAFTEIWNEVIVYKSLIIKSQKPCCSSVEQGRTNNTVT